MNRIATLIATTALGAAGVFGTAPAHAVATCTPVVVVPVTATPNVLGIPHDIVDVAVASATCADLSLVGHTANFVFDWYYSGGVMPACPSSQTSVTVLNNLPALTVAGLGTCQRPSSSPAATSVRWVNVDLYVDGALYSSSGLVQVIFS